MVQFANTESFLFFASILLGFFIGFYYEIFRFLRLAFPHPDFLIILEDLCFFIPLSPALIFFHYALNSGVFRWFSLAGCVLGFLLYLWTVGKILIRCSEGILFCIKTVLKGFYGVFIRPLYIVFKKITNCLYSKGKVLVIMKRKRFARKRLLRKKKHLSRSAEKGFQ